MVKLTTLHYGLIALALFLYYLWINEILSKSMIAFIAVGGIILFILKQPKEAEHFLTLEEAIQLVELTIPKLQDKNIVKEGTIKILDAGIQMLVMMDEMRPWRYMVGYQISGARKNYDYLMTVSVTGSVLSNEEREAGWKLADEALLLKVTAPTAELGVIPRSATAEEIKVGEPR